MIPRYRPNRRLSLNRRIYSLCSSVGNAKKSIPWYILPSSPPKTRLLSWVQHRQYIKYLDTAYMYVQICFKKELSAVLAAGQLRSKKIPYWCYAKQMRCAGHELICSTGSDFPTCNNSRHRRCHHGKLWQLDKWQPFVRGMGKVGRSNKRELSCETGIISSHDRISDWYLQIVGWKFVRPLTNVADDNNPDTSRHPVLNIGYVIPITRTHRL
jgi:hypothetical protein